MLDIKLIRDQLTSVKTGVAVKGYAVSLVDQAHDLDQKRRTILVDIENLRAARNKLTKDQITEGKKIKDQLRSLEPELKKIEFELNDVMQQIPNLPSFLAPVG